MTRNPAQQLPKPADMYALHRCSCRHLLYTDDVPGEPCRWEAEGLCDCTDHRPVTATPGQTGGAS